MSECRICQKDVIVVETIPVRYVGNDFLEIDICPECLKALCAELAKKFVIKSSCN